MAASSSSLSTASVPLKRSSAVAGLDHVAPHDASSNYNGRRPVEHHESTWNTNQSLSSLMALNSITATPTPILPGTVRIDEILEPSLNPSADHDLQLATSTPFSNTDQAFDQETPEVCFGMLINILAAPLHKSNQRDVIAQHRGSDTSWAVTFRSSVAVLLDEHLAEVGQLGLHHSLILCNLKQKVPSLRCDVFLFSSESSKSDRKCLKNAFEAIVNLYGAKFEADQVGSHLDEAKLFLQEPLSLQPGTIYVNPHVLTVENHRTPLLRHKHNEAHKGFANAISSILNQSLTFEDRSEFSQNERIKTRLAAHQVAAVKFAMLRESEFVVENTPTLWHQISTSFGPQYMHTLTKVLNSMPQNECRGGLLADEMGMGKSLSMLALIVHSLEEAQAFTQVRLSLSYQSQLTYVKATLIITPKSTINGWRDETYRHLHTNDLGVVVYHGLGKEQALTLFEQATIVLTTYETVARSWSPSNNVFSRYSWFRIILDEAQLIRNPSTQAFSAVNSLHAQRRWCLTGTPVQNGLSDIFALTRFLSFDPFITPKDVRAHITGPLSRHEEQGLTNLHSMMRVCSLRRMKTHLELPPIKMETTMVTLSDRERDQYEKVKSDLFQQLSEALRRGKRGTSTLTLSAIRKLRQICCHGLRVESIGDPSVSQGSVHKSRTCDGCQTVLIRPPCSDDPESPCEHVFCDACTSADSQAQEGALDGVWTCPACDQFGDVSRTDDHDPRPDLDGIRPENFVDDLKAARATSKMKAVLDALIGLHGNGTFDVTRPLKSLVFSCWIRALDTIESGLLLNHISYVRMDGQTSLQHREQATTRFQNDSTCTIALLTLGTGSVGLNLTAASHVHLIEPHWNPMVEEQAAARVHRIGQTREVTVHRYIVQNSVEEGVQSRQRHKFNLARLVGMGDDFAEPQDMGQEDVDMLESVF